MRYKNWSIRKKLLISMVGFSVIPIILVTAVALGTTYQTMRGQLTYNYRMSSVWLQDRLEQKAEEYSSRFYEFEVDKQTKDAIMGWCMSDEELDYTDRWQIITALNNAISMDNALNSIELFNYQKGEVLVAERAGARMEATGDRLDEWNARSGEEQTNLVFWRSENEILVAHQIMRFSDKEPLALIVMHLRPYELQRILEDIKSTPEESIVVLGDGGCILEADYGTGAQLTEQEVRQAVEQLSAGDSRDAQWGDNFWFYQPVSGGKLQILLVVPNAYLLNALGTTLLGGIGAAVVAVILSVICSVLYSRAVSRPIAELSGQMRNFIIKDEELRLPEGQTHEVAVLQESFRVMVERNQRLIATEFQTKLEKRNAQLRALQAQINPHFMYNTLQVIGGMALKYHASEVYQMTVELSDILRYSLNFSREMLPLRQEMKYLNSYIAIQNQRFGQRICWQVDIPEEALDVLVPKLILQPLIENCFEHGLVDKAGSWTIRLQGGFDAEGALELTVSDNGTGVPPWRLEQIRQMLRRDAERALGTGAHIGLRNVDSRIRLRYPDGNYGVEIDSRPNEGTTVRVRLKAVYEEGRTQTDDKIQSGDH